MSSTEPDDPTTAAPAADVVLDEAPPQELLDEVMRLNKAKKARDAEQRAHDNEVVARQYGIRVGDSSRRRGGPGGGRGRGK